MRTFRGVSFARAYETCCVGKMIILELFRRSSDTLMILTITTYKQRGITNFEFQHRESLRCVHAHSCVVGMHTILQRCIEQTS